MSQDQTSLARVASSSGLAYAGWRRFSRSDPGQRAPLALAPPGDQVRGVQSLAPEQRTDLARFARCRCLAQDAPFILGRKLPALGLCRDLRIRATPPPLGAARGRNSARPTGSLR